jgi:hypothetical protein
VGLPRRKTNQYLTNKTMDHDIESIKNKNRDHPGINRERVEKKIQGDQKDHMIKNQNRSSRKKILRDHLKRSKDNLDQKILRLISITVIKNKDQKLYLRLNTPKHK